ncbi:hypothetical protein QJS10_CPA06g00353 [Acorus calamus]|uniref:Transposase n=1 Tax=Acorus calamus TaxID=4465 RepID=A0AAV9ENM8_ACOCL|nr:hypothetical protein QJS10_CPA06g00353 [Acorus calamus]
MVWYLHGENVEDDIGECNNKNKQDILNTIIEGLEYIKKITDLLNEKFEFDGTWVVVGKYLDERMNAMFRGHKYDLKVKYIKDRDPAVVKEGPIPPNVSIEDWRTFVDICNSEEHKAISERNAINRSKLKSSSTLGRKSMAVVRHEMAMERNATSDAEISRSEVYNKAHTKKDKTVQIPDILGNDTRGRMRGMGAGINKTVFKNATSIIQKNLKLEKEKTQMGEKIEILQAEMNNVKALLANMNVPQTTTSASIGVVGSGGSQTQNVGGSGGLPNSSSEGSTAADKHNGKKCSLLNYDFEIVAHGEIVAADPMFNVHGSRMGNGFYKVLLIEIIKEDADLFKGDGIKANHQFNVFQDDQWVYEWNEATCQKLTKTRFIKACMPARRACSDLSS